MGSVPPSLIWEVLTEDELKCYLDARPQGISCLADALQLSDYQFDARSAIKLDYYSHFLELGECTGMSVPQMGALLSIAQEILKMCQGQAQRGDVERAVKARMLSFCGRHESGTHFSSVEIAEIMKVVSGSFLQHYNLYSYVLAHDQPHAAQFADCKLEIPVIQSFEKAMSEDEWQDYNAAIEKMAEEKRAAEEKRLQEKWEAEQKEIADARKAEEERIRQEELKKKPQTLEEAVEHAVTVRLHEERLALEKEYKAREDQMLGHIERLKQQIEGQC